MVALEPQIRRDMVAVGRELSAAGLVTSTHGSLSARLDSDLILVTPSGVAKGELTRASAVKISLSGKREFVGAKPTSALPLHKALYTTSPAAAIVHGLPSHALATLKSVSASLESGQSEHVRLGATSVLVVGGANASQAAEAIEAALGDAQAVCVDGLGLFTWGNNLALAMGKLQSLEEVAASSQSAPVAHAERSDAERPVGQSGTQLVAGEASPVASTGISVSPRTYSEACNACGLCTNSGGCVPSARQEVALDALHRLTDAELVALVVEATREVLTEKGLL
ncbi:MAG: class II aldolase/adducin family protein [Limnochordia bacterium]